WPAGSRLDCPACSNVEAATLGGPGAPTACRSRGEAETRGPVRGGDRRVCRFLRSPAPGLGQVGGRAPRGTVRAGGRAHSGTGPPSRSRRGSFPHGSGWATREGARSRPSRTATNRSSGLRLGSFAGSRGRNPGPIDRDPRCEGGELTVVNERPGAEGHQVRRLSRDGPWCIFSQPGTSRRQQVESNPKLTTPRLVLDFRKGDGVRPQPRLLMITVSRC